MLTLQETFDKVALHLIQQNARSAEEGVCKYRDPEGRECAVGALIPDDRYKPEFDNSGLGAVGRALNNSEFKAALVAGGVDVDNAEVLNLLNLLQVLHDRYQPRDWRARLKQEARHFKLNINVLEKEQS